VRKIKLALSIIALRSPRVTNQASTVRKIKLESPKRRGGKEPPSGWATSAQAVHERETIKQAQYDLADAVVGEECLVEGAGALSILAQLSDDSRKT